MNGLHPLSRYYDPHFRSEIVKIKPGEYFVTTRPIIIATVLGSCVAACVRDAVRGWAGMNHFMLPWQPDGQPGASLPQPSLRYGNFAMESLIDEFTRRGSRPADLEAKVFGGAAVVEHMGATVGQQNAQFVIEYLEHAGIRTSAVDLGGVLPRKVLLFVDTGEVRVKYIEQLQDPIIVAREAEYARTLHAASAGFS